MTTTRARVWIVLVGMALPYLARLPGGVEWLQQYTSVGLGGWFFLGAFNAIAWGAILSLSWLYRHPASVVCPVVLGFGFLAWAHGTLDLSADAQAAIALVVIPVFALGPIAIGGVLGYVLDRRLRRRA